MRFDRRSLVLTLLAAAAGPAAAQQPTTLRIGYLMAGQQRSAFETAFEKGLRERGYVVGRNAVVDYRPGARSPQELDQTLGAFVGQGVDAIVVIGGPAVRAAKRLTSKIPIVFTAARDPVGDGSVASLAKPGTNATGQSVHAPELSPKRLQVLREAFPAAKRLALFWSRPNPHQAQIAEAKQGAAALGLDLSLIDIKVPEELDQAFAQARADGAAAGFVISDLSTISNREEIGAAALRAGLPLLVSNRSYLTGGALMSYGPDVADGFRRAAHQVVRAAQGEADLPVEQPLRIELVVDLRAARALGLSLPLETLARADEVIE